MKINKDAQYAILFILYLSRAGRATVDAAAESLNLSGSMLAQIARKLKLKGLIHSIRGPGGGYEIIGSPSIKDALIAFNAYEFLTPKQTIGYSLGNSEARAFVHMLHNLSMSQNLVLNRKITSVMNELTINETKKLDSLKVTDQGH